MFEFSTLHHTLQYYYYTQTIWNVLHKNSRNFLSSLFHILTTTLYAGNFINNIPYYSKRLKKFYIVKPKATCYITQQANINARTSVPKINVGACIGPLVQNPSADIFADIPRG